MARRGPVIVTKVKMNDLVMKFLADEGHISSALTFFKESGTKYDEDFAPPGLINMSELSENIEHAITIFTDSYPQMLDLDLYLLFRMLQQWFIEKVRNRRVEEALDFGEDFIVPFVEECPQYKREFEKAISLVAFEDPYDCPDEETRKLLGISRLLRTASMVNEA